MNECGLDLSDSPLVGKLSQEEWGTGDRGAIPYNLYNCSFDMSDSTVFPRPASDFTCLLAGYLSMKWNSCEHI